MAKKNKAIDELLKLIRLYWEANPNLDFGAMLDRVMSIEANVKHLSHITNDEWMMWFTNQLKEPQFFSKDTLESLRLSRFKQYHSLSSMKELYDKEPTPLFFDGKFNQNNYFGGDDIIRNFFTKINEGQKILVYPEVIVEVGEGRTQNIGMIAQEMDNEEYIMFQFIISGMEFSGEQNQQIFHNAVFGLNKNNTDVIDFCWFSGQEMTEEHYIYLLNVIQQTGFNFFEERREEEIET